MLLWVYLACTCFKAAFVGASPCILISIGWPQECLGHIWFRSVWEDPHTRNPVQHLRLHRGLWQSEVLLCGVVLLYFNEQLNLDKVGVA